MLGLDDRAFRHFDIGWVIERRLRALEGDPALRPWVDAGAALARRGDGVARRGLIYAVFRRGGFDRDTALGGVAALLLDSLEDDEEAGLIAECVVDAALTAGVEWRPVFDRLRREHAARTDAAVFGDRVDASRAALQRLRLDVLAYWRAVAEASWVSRGVLERFDAGMALEAVFALETYREIRRAAMRAG